MPFKIENCLTLMRKAVPIAVMTAALLAETAIAQGATDPVQTGSISQAQSALPATAASKAFRDALGLLKTDKAAAYAAAKALTNTTERRVVQWAAIYYGSGEVDYQSVLRFAADAPAFATASLYKTRMEQAFNKTERSSSEILKALGGAMPNTLQSQVAQARAYVADGQAERGGRIIKSIWTAEFLDDEYETRILSEFGRFLDNQDHWDRAVHLLMHDRARGTERIMDKLTPAQKSLALARIAVSREQKNVQALIDKVDPSMRGHSLFHFTRGQDGRHRGQLAEAVKFLDMAQGSLAAGTAIDAAEFWYERRLITRRALAAGDFKTAFAAAAGYKDGPEGRFVEARFHAGWIALTYLNDPATARDHFLAMSEKSTLTDTVTQSNYWLGRAYKALGDSANANAAFKAATRFPNAYYGILANLELGQKGITIRPLPSSAESEALFESHELVKAIELLIEVNRKDLAEPLMARLAYQVETPGEMILAARLAQSINAHNLAILIADIADRRGFALDLFNYPKDGLPSQAKLAEIDKAAIYAVARQESRFDADATSRVGARGLMQLMPATAREVAGKIGIAYAPAKLADPAYNAQLGSTYLSSQLDRYDGSLVLAAAAYNAGAGNVNKWLKIYGDPRNDKIDVVAWVETIPLEETRDYVQRVMANYMVYRARLGNQSLTLQEALRRIPH